jgi:hypothetical protein
MQLLPRLARCAEIQQQQSEGHRASACCVLAQRSMLWLLIGRERVPVGCHVHHVQHLNLAQLT